MIQPKVDLPAGGVIATAWKELALVGRVRRHRIMKFSPFACDIVKVLCIARSISHRGKV